MTDDRMLAPAHALILRLAKEAIDLESSPEWKRDAEAAAEKHADACDALWDELRRQTREDASE